ncbi:hypothetical protein HMPREF3223_02293 [Cutibacterium avidum]|nr:hypothetical protein HMPREF3223_02293 [Cutibacterium avidum]
MRYQGSWPRHRRGRLSSDGDDRHRYRHKTKTPEYAAAPTRSTLIMKLPRKTPTSRWPLM